LIGWTIICMNFKGKKRVNKTNSLEAPLSFLTTKLREGRFQL
jgi:hypothetical protein